MNQMASKKIFCSQIWKEMNAVLDSCHWMVRSKNVQLLLNVWFAS